MSGNVQGTSLAEHSLDEECLGWCVFSQIDPVLHGIKVQKSHPIYLVDLVFRRLDRLMEEIVHVIEFFYVAHDNTGKRFTGSFKAESKAEALKLLSERYEIVTRLEHRTESRSLNPFAGRVRGDDLLGFCETFAAMLEGGINLKRALDTIVGDTRNPALRNVVMDLSARVGGGDSLSQALGHHSHIFGGFFVHMVEAGESSGELPEMLRRVAAFLEKSEKMKDRVKAALTYPTVVLAFAALMVAAILAFGVPYLEELYDGLGIELPGPTKFLVSIGSFMNDQLLLLILFLFLFFWLFWRFLNNPKGRAYVDSVKLRAPLLSGLFQLLYTGRFARTLALLYSSGVPLLNALGLTARSVGNEVVAKSIAATEEDLKAGGKLSDSLRINPYFSEAAIGLIAAGEESGKLDLMLLKVADFYDRKADAKLEALTSIVEPLIMIMVGIVIGGIIVTLGLPFLTLASNF